METSSDVRLGPDGRGGPVILGRMSLMGLGCVKTPKLNLRIEISSRQRQFEKQKCWRPVS